MVRLWQIGFVLLMALLLAGCNARALREAERTLAMADSLRAEGTAYTDSVRLAETVDALQSHQRWHPAAWAKANYYYGRLLRGKNNQVAAMQCFIRASHAHTHDKLLLGRIYSNMANMCREKGEHALAYEVYNTSADIFLRAGDSIRYFYALDNMSFELAALKDSAVFCLLDSIDSQCRDAAVRMKTIEMKAIAFEAFRQYDSVLICTEQLLKAGYTEATGYLIRARAFEHTNQPDSALYYAQKVMEISPYGIDKYNALYILTHYDATLNTDSLLSLSADRADYGKAVEKEQANLAQAVQLLQQDREQKPNRSWVVIMLSVTLSLVLLTLLLFLLRRNRKQKAEQEKERQELIAKHQKETEQLQQIEQQYQNELQQLQIQASSRQIELEHICAALRSLTNDQLKHELCWNNFACMRSIVNARMFLLVDKLEQLHSLNENEIRLCILVLIGVKEENIADICNYAKSGIGKFKYNTVKKLGTTSKYLHNDLVRFCIKGTGFISKS